MRVDVFFGITDRSERDTRRTTISEDKLYLRIDHVLVHVRAYGDSSALWR